MVAALVVAYLSWRYPRAASASRSSPPTEEPGKDEGLALVLLLALGAEGRLEPRGQALIDPFCGPGAIGLAASYPGSAQTRIDACGPTP